MITNQLKETQRNYLMETAKVLFPKKKGCESSAAYRNVVRAADILFMVTENLSRKLVSRCAAAAMALIITIAGMGASSAGTSDSAVAAQEVQTTAVETTTTQQTVAYSMSTYKASQGAYSGSAYSSAVTKATTSATTTAATTAKSAATTKAVAATKSAAKTTAAAKKQVYTAAATVKPAVTTAPVTTTAPDPNAGVVTTGKAPVMIAEQTIDTDHTHPWNKQTSQITVHWNAFQGAKKYMLFVYGGKFTKWTEIATTDGLKYTVAGLARDTAYSFAVKGVDEEGKSSDLSAPVVIKTARMDYSAAGWQAMCRIVYHEVGGAAGSFWDKPIVYVADCVANQYVCAKYTLQGTWPKYYARYSNIESIIYSSGGFASSATLSARGANYSNVSARVKLAVWGAVYGVTAYNGIVNDYNIFFWNSTYYKPSSAKLGYTFKTPFGNYVNIWRQFWG